MSEERIQKILARAGVASRRKAEELIRDGLVTVNGQVAGIGDKADPGRDAIKVDGRRIHPGEGHRYLLLNKPKGVVSTLADPEGRPTVLDMVPPSLRKALVPVGRLDFNTEGLLLLTDDGDFAQRVGHPRYGCWKTYEVKVKGLPEEEELERLRAGVVIEGKRTSPCRIRPRDGGSRRPHAPRKRAAGTEGDGENSWWVVELSEGRTRQIREMFFQIGHPVQKLRRVAIGPVRDPDLPVGSLRDLTEKEIERLRKAATPAAGKKKPVARKRMGAPAGEARAVPSAQPAQSAKPAKPAKPPRSRSTRPASAGPAGSAASRASRPSAPKPPAKAGRKKPVPSAAKKASPRTGGRPARSGPKRGRS